MIITCGECDSSFVLDDSLVKASGSKVRCSKCKNVFMAYPTRPQQKAKSKKTVEPAFDMAVPADDDRFSLEDDPDLAKAVAAINEDELDFTDEELGIESFAKPAKVDEKMDLKPAAAAAAVAAASAGDGEAEDDGDLLDFSDFEIDEGMDAGSSETSVIEEEELDFSDLELELSGGSKGDKRAAAEVGEADKDLGEEMDLDLSGLDEESEPDLDLALDEGESADETLMVDDELDFSDLERELDGALKDEPASVDELDLGFDADESGDQETVVMEDDDLDFSEFELDADEAAGKKSAKVAAEKTEGEEELDFSGFADILESEIGPEETPAIADEDLDLELDMDLDSDGPSMKKDKDVTDDEEELDFSDLEELLDGIEESDSDEKASEDIHLELDDDEAVAEAAGHGDKAKVAAHAEDDLDFSDVEAMLGETGESDDDLGFDGDLGVNEEEELNLALEGEENDIELELDMDEQDEEDVPAAQKRGMEDEEEELSMLSQTVTMDGPKEDRFVEEKTKPKAKPKRLAKRSGMGFFKIIIWLVVLLLILFGVYIGKGKVKSMTGMTIPDIAPLESVRESLSKIGIPGLGFLGSSGKDSEGSVRLRTSGITGKPIPNPKLGGLYVISGTIQNLYPESRNSISLLAKLYGQGGKVEQTCLFYAGNIIPESELISMDAAVIKARMQNRLGDNRSNAAVKSGQSVPFMAIFINPGNNLTEFTVVPAGSSKGEAAK